VSLAVTGMRLTNDLDSPPYAAKYGVASYALKYMIVLSFRVMTGVFCACFSKHMVISV
ncbi:hypothetical protein A2U01_0024625, partial [Trifolium medium]|nr:hypothetical protein [Trifolium medium]